MKSKSYTDMKELAKDLGLDPQLGEVAQLKAMLIKEIREIFEKKDLTHQEVADLSGVPRSAITGIVSGSLQRVTVDRLIRVLAALGKSFSLKIKDAA